MQIEYIRINSKGKYHCYKNIFQCNIQDVSNLTEKYRKLRIERANITFIKLLEEETNKSNFEKRKVLVFTFFLTYIK